MGKTEAEELPEDLTVEVLMKVPIKPMMRLITVSKDWLRLIHTNPFAFLPRPRTTCFFVFCVRRYSNKNILPISVLLRRWSDGGDPITKISPQIDLPQQHQERGVFCIYPAGCGFLVFFKLVFDSDDLFLWNPTTKQNIVLPPSPYDPYIHATIVGFATVVECKDHGTTTFSYKVGRLLVTRDRSIGRSIYLSLELYSSKTKSWKFIPNFSTVADLYIFNDNDDYSYVLPHCVNLNGKIHWAIQSPGYHMYVTAFDYETEVFTRIKAPTSGGGGGYYYDKRKCLVTLFDDKFLCLGLITQTSDDECTSYLDIWVLRQYEDENSWVKEFSIGPLNKYIQVVGFSSKVQSVFLRRAGNLYLCDCKSSVHIDCIPIVNTGEKLDYVQVVEQSLVSL